MSNNSKSQSNNEDSQSPATSSAASSSSFNSNFQLPNYILKNLTPIKGSSTRSIKEHKISRKIHLHSRSSKLRERKILMNERLINLKRQREMLINQRLKDLNKSLKLAQLRRNDYLDSIREKARSLQRKLIISNDENYEVYPVSACQSCSPKDMYYSEDQMNQIIKCQRFIKHYFVIKNIRLLRLTRFLEIFERLSFNKCIKLLQTSSVEKLSMFSILKNLNVPDISPLLSYKTFFYSFILICDFKESVKKGLHPGFNSNTDDIQLNLFNNFIWLLLFKFANELILSFKNLIESDLGLINIERLKFLRIWRNYNFLFKIFKVNHFKNIKKLLNQSLTIINRQLGITNNDMEILDQRENLINEKRLLNKYRQASLELNVNLNEEEFAELIKSSLMSKTIPNNFHYRILTNQISFEEYKFTLPPILSDFHWRKYWFNRFRNEHEEHRQFPTLIRSGYLSSNKFDSLHIDEVLEYLSLNSVYEEFNKLTNLKDLRLLEEIIKLLNDDFLNLIKFGQIFKRSLKNKNNEAIIIKFNEIIKENVENLVHLKRYLIKYFALLSELISYNDNTNLKAIPLKCLTLSSTTNELTYEILDEIIRHYQEFKILMINLWINKCKFSNFNKFRIFENIWLFARNNNNLRFEIFTNSPNLKFPLFYKFLSMNNYTPDLNDYLKILNGSVELPNLFCDETNLQCYNYFRKTFHNSIISGTIEKNEFNELFLNDFKILNRRLNNVIESNLILNLILNFYSHFKSSNQAISLLGFFKPGELFQEIINYIHYEHKAVPINKFLTLLISDYLKPLDTNLQTSKFLCYFRLSKDKIKCLLLKKFTILLDIDNKSYEFNKILLGNFKYCNELITNIILDIYSLVSYIYKLYNPLLNWIYKDLGEPSF